MKKQLTTLAILLFLSSLLLYSQEHQNNHKKDSIQTEQLLKSGHKNTDHHKTNHSEDHEGGHGSMGSLFFIIIALFIGTGVKHFLHKSPIPYTVTLLIIGLALGGLNRMGYFEYFHIGTLDLSMAFISESISWAGTINPHLILYVFLPVLIFEAAFALDVHTFQKSFGNALILAVPGILVAMLLTAIIAMGISGSGLGLSSWDWTVALMFGAVISATDPVAVVSLLKELGASKKLRTLIESESLLNDGTAIVLFMVFLLGLTGASTGGSPIFEFFRVAFGGIILGAVIGYIVIYWVKRVFNDALFEITVIISAAFLTFFIAEHFLHVSGVLGLVTLGLLMAGTGRTRISPEVWHFLHEFWELAAFLANTLIFIIVGVVIASQIVFTGTDFVILGIIYIGIHVVRAIVIGMFYPIMRKIGYGVTVKDSVVAWWGGLRGAIGLALALIIAEETKIPLDIRNQFLFLTAGIVILTSLINATTVKIVVNKLGLTRVAPAKAQMMENVNKFLIQSSEHALDKIKEDRFMSGANWNQVREYLPKTSTTKTKKDTHHDTFIEFRRRILEHEKSNYWMQFQNGLLSSEAVHGLSDEIDGIIDKGGTIPLDERKDPEQLWQTNKLISRMQSYPIVGKYARRLFFEKLTVGYDISRGFVAAQEASLKLIESMAITRNKEKPEDAKELDYLEDLESEINANRIVGLTFMRNLRDSFPEIYIAIETKQAIRSLLNHERELVKRLLKKGRIEKDEASKMLEAVEGNMKRLNDTPPTFDLHDPAELIKEVPWLKGIRLSTLKKIIDSFETHIYGVGEKLMREGKHGESLFIVVRGTVKIEIHKKVIDIVGPGSVIGEIAIYMNTPRTATAMAESPVTALKISNTNLREAIEESEELNTHLWKLAGVHSAENLLGDMVPYTHWPQTRLRNWLAKGEITKLENKQMPDIKNKVAILLKGTAFGPYFTNGEVKAPVVLPSNEVDLSDEAIIFICQTEEGML